MWKLGLCLLLLGAMLGYTVAAPPVVMQQWSVKLPSSFYGMGIDRTAETLVVNVENGEGKNALLALDGSGHERWRITPTDGKILLGNISADAHAVLCTRIMGTDENKTTVSIQVLNGATGKELATKTYQAGLMPTGTISDDGSSVLCADLDAGYLALHALKDGTLQELWSTQSINPPLPNLDLQEGNLTAALLPNGYDTLVAYPDGHIYQVGQKGNRQWEINFGVPMPTESSGLMFSSSKKLMLIRGIRYLDWPGNPIPLKKNEVTARWLKNLAESRLGVYNMDWLGTGPANSSIDTLWGSGTIGSVHSVNIRWADAALTNNVLYLLVLYEKDTLIYTKQLKSFDKEENVYTVDPSISQGLSAISLRDGLSYFAALSSPQTEGKKPATHLYLVDLETGKPLAEMTLPGEPGVGMHSVFLSSDGTKMVAVAGDNVFYYSITR